MKSKNAYYLVVDVFPKLWTHKFYKYAGAVVGCWIRHDIAKDENESLAFVAKKLLLSSWEIGRIISTETVNAQTYRNNKDGIEFFRQALIDGFVFHFHMVEREVVEIGSSQIRQTQKQWKGVYESFIEEIGGCIYSLSSIEDKQWANGASPNGADFFPVWSNQDAVKKWEEYWPGYEIEKIDSQEFLEYFLNEIYNSDMFLAIGVLEKLLITCHPISFSKFLKKK